MNILKILRPHQWVKNTFIFIPLFFGGSLFDMADWTSSLVAFVAFSFAASAIYSINDIVDVEADKKHPKKCKRPIAAGLVSKRQASLLAIILAIAALALPFLLNNWMLSVVIAVYLAMNLCYCIRLKHYAIIDVCIVALGFVMRIVAGGVATDIVLSRWIVMMTFLLTLFLSFAKRRDDVLIMNETGMAPRKNTSRYNLTFINQAITITGGVMLVCYIMYTVSPEVIERFNSPNLYMTSFFVILGLLRYIQLTVVDERSGEPTRLVLSDRLIQLIIAGWIISFAIIIYT
ncbi:decaprenyl-phosphate phosphoribosyltransferase [Prevotella sp. P2-180]|uniref:decaprenyl-phosphate phosphoribosyltransferase n=1 Tax=Prevotella sp. P2-180 TaxID=2024224 RepID=UPI000B96DBE4|nr:decaprenyl-phosphate phosphoribosyltransferase [Prevotella sp. P2-180]MDD5785175.1 decaprenyl-phosphate phosphoribosyltransferase [Prevotella sp.]OYP69065.1 decaprenyl-phosphate phosphoribosyltransferase [Prevotella sp. P2-180]